jgi:putative glutamine amidotransferase
MKPVIGVVCDTTQQGLHTFHQAGNKYLQAITRCSGGIPLLIPALSDQITPKEALSRLDGILLTGGYSNIGRHHYGVAPAPDDEHEDAARDQNNFALIPEILSMGLPLFGICRGFQELNVALGGTLHPRLQEVDGRFDHRENKEDPIEIQYGPAHSVTVATDGLLERIVGEREFMVNTVHGQGINQLADGLTLEAEADDTTIEAVSVTGAHGFALAVQWHPEWHAWENPQSTKLFAAFGAAARNYQTRKGHDI